MLFSYSCLDSLMNASCVKLEVTVRTVSIFSFSCLVMLFSYSCLDSLMIASCVKLEVTVRTVSVFSYSCLVMHGYFSV